MRTLALLVVLSSASHALALGREDVRALQAVADTLAELRVEDAARALEPIARREAEDPQVLESLARVRFYQGRYDAAREAIEEAVRRRPNERREAFAALVLSTVQATAGYVESRSEDGRFVVLHAPGRDRHLVSYALRAMQAADRVLEQELGYRMPGPVRLEIFPTAASLAEVSTLSLEAIERTGTIALCKWDKLMVTSPRALLRGYPWMDTIAHEYVHLVLTRSSRDHAPVWFQEGVAKFMERRWREDTLRPHLGPASRGLLARAISEDRLIPFERIHPSIALLPSQEDAALAFAQVSTFVSFFHETFGAEALRKAIAAMAEGTDAQAALAAEASTSWPTLERRWKSSLTGLDPDAPDLLPLRLRHGEASDDEARDVAERARRGLRLGDMLWSRQRFGGAMVEYGRAAELAPDNPILAARLARAAIAAGEPERAIAALDPMLERYPEHAPTWSSLARARRMLGDRDGAREAARAAIRLNPFDPSPHCDLAEVESDERTRSEESDRCRELGGT